MKIAFVIAGVKPVYSLKEIRNAFPESFDKETFDFIKVLEKNKDFESTVLDIRKRLNIPQKGYSFSQYFDLAIKKDFQDHDFTKEFKVLLTRTTLESIPLLNTFKLPNKVAREIPYIIIANIVHTIDKAIEVEYIDEGKTDDYFILRPYHIIKINNKISKTEFIQWINVNWNKELRFIQSLPEKPSLNISKRDEEIVRLRDKEGLRFKDIPSKIIAKFKFDDSEANINENSIKMAYKRAKDIIKSLKK